MVEDVRRLRHLGHEGGLAAADAVVETYARVDSVCEAHGSRRGGHEAPRLRHDDDERGLTKEGGLAGHVRPGDESDFGRSFAPEFEVVGDELSPFNQSFEDGMTPAVNSEDWFVKNGRADVVPARGALRERGDGVE